MAIIKLTGFTGEMPRVTPRLLPATGAQIAQSVRLEDGELSPYRKPAPVYDLPGATEGNVKTIYKHLTDWLYWSTVVNAVPGPVASDRLYYTGDGVPKMRVGSTVYNLALLAPAAALTSARVGALTALTSTVLYVRTFVTSFGEESEPCPISADLVVSPGNTVTLSGFTLPPAGRAIVNERIYRSQTGSAGGTNLYFLAERVCSTANFTDTFPADDFSEAIPSLDWNPPPDGLAGLVALPGGMMAGFVGKDLYISEPFRPHAWPEKYVLTTNYDIVALGVYGTTIVVGTKGNPYLVGGTSPDTMVMERMELNMPCLNAQGMIDMGYAIAYPSHDGLVVVQNGSASVMTAGLMTRDQWLKLLPAQMVCGQFYGRFFGSYDYFDVDGSEVKGTLILDLTGASPFIIRSQHRADAFFYQVETGSLFMVIGTTVYEWDALTSTPDIYTWRSKTFVLPAPTSFGAVLFEVVLRNGLDEIIALENALAVIAAANAVIFAGPSLMGALNVTPVNTYAVNGDALLPGPMGSTVSVNIYADGVLVASLNKAGRMQRLPSGKLAREWEIEITGNANIQELTMAGTAQELRGV